MAGSEDDILIGAVLPFTGAQAAEGSNQERAILLALEQLNDAGGIDGRKLRLLARDSHSSIERGLAAATELLESGRVNGLLGPSEADLVSQVLPLLGKYRVPVLSGSIALPTHTPSESDGFFFRTTPSNLSLSSALAGSLQHQGATRVAILYADDSYGRSLASTVSDQLAKRAIAVVASTRLSASAASFGSELQAVSALHPDALVLVSYPPMGATVLNEWTAISVNATRFYLAPSLRTDGFVENVIPGTLEGQFGVTAAVATDAEAFVRTFASRWPDDAPLPGAFFYYDSAALLGLAIASAHTAAASPSGEQIRDALPRVSAATDGRAVPWYDLASGLQYLKAGTAINYRGASGSFDLLASGEIANGLVRKWTVSGSQIVDGELVLAQPL